MRSAMEAFAERGWPAELIVCDNNSEDRTAELARAAGARVVFEPVNQIARARNTGAARAAGEWLIFIDADSQPSRELFAEAADAMQGGRCLAGGATLAFPGCSAAIRAPSGPTAGVEPAPRRDRHSPPAPGDRPIRRSSGRSPAWRGSAATRIPRRAGARGSDSWADTGGRRSRAPYRIRRLRTAPASGSRSPRCT